MTPKTGTDDPRVAETLNEAIALDANDDTAMAVLLLKSLATEFPTIASVHGYLGWFLSRQGHHDEAIAHSGQAVSLAPQSEKASLIHFHVLWKSGKPIEALDEMRRFLLLRPSAEYGEIIKHWNP